MAVTVKRCAGGLVMADGQVLLLRKRLNDEIRVPKGKVEPGETAAEAALREVAEETGYADLRIIAELPERTHRYRHGGELIEQVLTVFAMGLASHRRVGRNPRDARRFEVRWFPVDQAVESLTFGVEQQLMQDALGPSENGQVAGDQ